MTRSTKNGCLIAFKCFQAALGVLFLYFTVISPTVAGRTSSLLLGLSQFISVALYLFRQHKLASSEESLGATEHALPDSE